MVQGLWFRVMVQGLGIRVCQGPVWCREIGNLLPNIQRQRCTCYALCLILYPVSAAPTSIFRMDSNSTFYSSVVGVLSGGLGCRVRGLETGVQYRWAGFGGSLYPHGGGRPFHQTSTFITQFTLRPCVVQIWLCIPQNSGETKPSKSTEWYRAACEVHFR